MQALVDDMNAKVAEIKLGMDRLNIFVKECAGERGKIENTFIFFFPSADVPVDPILLWLELRIPFLTILLLRLLDWSSSSNLGGGKVARERHLSRKKLLPRDR